MTTITTLSRLILLTSALFLLVQTQAQSQDTTKTQPTTAQPTTAQKSLEDFSLEDLLNVEIAVASGKGKALSQRESPSIVTLITREEIINSGARDITDVLRLVPGFEFGLDVQGAVGITMRGNWAHEGKILFLWDGIPMNETLFGTVPLGNRFPLFQIERIEIIRGPGSAIFGGFAGMAVVNVITRTMQNIAQPGGKIGDVAINYSGSVMGSLMTQGLGRWGVDQTLGAQFGDVSVTLGMYGQRGVRSDRSFVSELDGKTYSMRQYFTDNAQSYNLGIKGSQWLVRAIYEDSQLGYPQPDTAGTIRLLTTRFPVFSADAQYTFSLSDKVQLTPRVSYTNQTPWATTDIEARRTNFYYEKTTSRLTGNLTLAAELSPQINVTAGAEYFLDNGFASDASLQAGAGFADGKQSVSYSTISAFAQGVLTSDIANVTLGARFDNHSRFGAAFAPRIGITKVIDRFHFKALLSRAFRAPTIENIDRNASIKPEFTTVIEGELGYQFSNTVFATLNVFDIDITDPIIYFFGGAQGGYKNATRMGTRGAEAEIRWRDKNINLAASYSFSTVNQNEVELYTAPQTTAQMLGMPQHKVAVNASVNITPDLSVNPSFVYLSERYAPVSFMGRGGMIQRTINPFEAAGLLNVNIAWTPEISGLRLMTISLAAMNVLDANYQFISPVSNGNNPFSGASREFVLRLSIR
ncbi:MAG: TonB-dependent receptor [Candidatus Kapaibacterium sp.]|nr:MAG: TonB-dependent receptor [Candidatus Kapabacteria bacterium]